MPTPTFTSAGAKATAAIKLPSDIFGLTVENHQLLKDVYLAMAMPPANRVGLISRVCFG